MHNNGDVQTLYVNAGTGSQDYNRLSTVCTGADNTGWGLGTTYDVQCIFGSCGSTYTCAGTSDRPQADAYMHHVGTHFSGGMIGADNHCINNCQWSTTSGYNYDYAIYVGTTPPSPQPTISPTFEATSLPTVNSMTSLSKSSVVTPMIRTDVLYAGTIHLNGEIVDSPRRLSAVGAPIDGTLTDELEVLRAHVRAQDLAIAELKGLAAEHVEMRRELESLRDIITSQPKKLERPC